MEKSHIKITCEVKDPKGTISESLKECMIKEMMLTNELYFETINKTNDDFKCLYPTYFKDNNDKEWYELAEYNNFVFNGYQLFLNKLYKSDINTLLDVYLDPEEGTLVGYLRTDYTIKVQTFMEDA